VSYLPGATFIAELGLSQEFQPDRVVGSFEAVPELCAPRTSVARTSVLLTIADMAAGSISSAATAPRICLTLDLSVRVLRPPVGVIDVEARVLKSGRNTTVAETDFRVGGELVALSWSTFVASPRPSDVIEVPPLSFRRYGPSRLRAPLADQVGCRIVAPGVAEVDRTPYVMNPAGTVQGGIVALLAELATESLPDVAGDAGVVSELDVRYLSATRVGPARATAEVVGDRTARVELHDPGNGDRLTAVVLARWAP
jgi:acyl-coenzyme A thioesterase PaaI-like protein